MSKPIFITNPHGAQALRYTEDKSMRHGQRVSNMLFTLRETCVPAGKEPAGMIFTGEELDSLCAEWIRFRTTEAGK